MYDRSRSSIVLMVAWQNARFNKFDNNVVRKDPCISENFIRFLEPVAYCQDYRKWNYGETYSDILQKMATTIRNACGGTRERQLVEFMFWPALWHSGGCAHFYGMLPHNVQFLHLGISFARATIIISNPFVAKCSLHFAIRRVTPKVETACLGAGFRSVFSARFHPPNRKPHSSWSSLSSQEPLRGTPLERRSIG